jgi:hypothetical protein
MRKILFILVLFPLILSAQASIKVSQIKAEDPEGTEVVFSILSGNTGSFFTITPCSGVISVKATAFDSFVNYRTWNLTVKATDETKLYSTKKWKIVLRKDSSGNKLPPEISVVL